MNTLKTTFDKVTFEIVKFTGNAITACLIGSTALASILGFFALVKYTVLKAIELFSDIYYWIT